MANIDENQLLLELSKQDREIVLSSRRTLIRHVKKVKSRTLNNFNNHLVTKEIEGGPTASNISGTLIGGRGNLFSFIGFPSNSKPIPKVRRAMKDFTISKPIKSKSGKAIDYTFEITYPSLESVEEKAPAPFDLGRSWVRGVETGISGLGHYIYKEFLRKSRSSTGLQVSNKVRAGKFKNTKYISSLLKTAEKELMDLKEFTIK